MLMVFSAVQPAKALLLMVFTPERSALSSAVQFWKALAPTVFTVEGRMMLSMVLLPLNALAPMPVIVTSPMVWGTTTMVSVPV